MSVRLKAKRNRRHQVFKDLQLDVARIVAAHNISERQAVRVAITTRRASRRIAAKLRRMQADGRLPHPTNYYRSRGA